MLRALGPILLLVFASVGSGSAQEAGGKAGFESLLARAAEPGFAATLLDYAREHPRDPRLVRGLARWIVGDDSRYLEAAAAAAIAVEWPYLDVIAAERLLEVEDATALRALAGALADSPTSMPLLGPIAARRDSRLREIDPGLADALLLSIALRRLPLTAWVGAWPGGPDAAADGFRSERETMPLRRTTGKKARLRLPPIQRPGTLLIGYRLEAGGRRKAGIRAGEKLLGELEIDPGPGPLTAFGAARAARLAIDGPLPEGAAALTIEVELDDGDALQLLGIGLLDEAFMVAPLDCVRLRPGQAAAIRAQEGFEISTRGLSEAVLKGDRGRLVLDLPETAATTLAKARSLHIDHASALPGSWEVLLDGQPLIQIISQDLPRAARCSLGNRGLRPGALTLEFRRLGGEAPLEVEAIRIF